MNDLHIFNESSKVYIHDVDLKYPYGINQHPNKLSQTLHCNRHFLIFIFEKSVENVNKRVEVEQSNNWVIYEVLLELQE